ncbi:hypothetical protein CCP3SC1_170026 [Gammaproteobacteria bacterium]
MTGAGGDFVVYWSSGPMNLISYGRAFNKFQRKRRLTYCWLLSR